MKYQLNTSVHYYFGRKLCIGEVVAVTIGTTIVSHDGKQPPTVTTEYTYVLRDVDNERVRDYPQANIDMAEEAAKNNE